MPFAIPLNPEPLTAFATGLGVVIGAVGILLACTELRQTSRQALASFEDQTNGEYRDIARKLPVAVFFGDESTDEEKGKAFPALYCYIDLLNEQVFLRQIGRVRKKTWEFWRDGIASNLERHAFAKAWKEIKQRADPSFSELRELQASSSGMDPYARWWQRWRR